jgi:eukaryotic-like serine/threonine-protein kinase
MPAPATLAEFVDLVRRSGLVPANTLDELLRRAQPPATADQAASALVRDGLLTFFQAKQLRQGRYKRFTIGSKYRLLELIGAGGMGAVYLCEHTIMKRLVALKVLPTDKLDDQSNLDRFFREARAVAALDHANIVRAYDIDQFEKLHFLVMEYVDGTSLQEIVARYTFEKKQLDPIRAAHYTAQAAVGMQHAHELGMVHRDIKPGNVLLDRNGVIKVLDMGLARFFHKQQDSVTEKYDEKCVLGTADYLAPEQAVSNVVDVRADIYALGGTLYFMLTGQTPFPDGTVAAKLVAHQTREPKPVDEYRSDVPPGLLAVLRTMMAKDANARYQTPIEVADALAEWTAIPIDPPPEREMPALCPLVRALMSGPTDRSSQSGSLSKALFAPGRGVFARGPGSSGSGSRPPAAGSSTPSASASASASSVGASYVAFPTVSPSDVSKARAKPEPLGALSTGRGGHRVPVGEGQQRAIARVQHRRAARRATAARHRVLRAGRGRRNLHTGAGAAARRRRGDGRVPRAARRRRHQHVPEFGARLQDAGELRGAHLGRLLQSGRRPTEGTARRYQARVRRQTDPRAREGAARRDAQRRVHRSALPEANLEREPLTRR